MRILLIFYFILAYVSYILTQLHNPYGEYLHLGNYYGHQIGNHFWPILPMTATLLSLVYCGFSGQKDFCWNSWSYFRCLLLNYEGLIVLYLYINNLKIGLVGIFLRSLAPVGSSLIHL